MKEKLIINNFAGIDHLEIELNKINILIGPQASGKSITAKLFYYFKTFINEISKEVGFSEIKKVIDRHNINRFIKYFPKETWPKNKFSIKYFVDNTWMKISKEHNKNILKFEYSESLKIIIREAKNIMKKEQEKYRSSNGITDFEIYSNFQRKFNDLVKKEIPLFSTYHQLFIPAGRSIFSYIQSNIFSLLKLNISLDPFLIEFGSLYENSKRIVTNYFQRTERKTDNKFESLINNILNSKYLREKEKDYLLHNDKRKVNLSNASSGQQEILPLLIILNTLMILKYSRVGTTLYIEEPEAHLFPDAQKKITQLLARVFNPIINEFQIIVTTHSPYILSSFNNLMYAGSLVNKLNKEKTKKIYKIIPKEEIIDTGVLSAFSLNLNGAKKNLIDKETKLISQNVLDNISNDISIEFGKLLDLEF